MMNFKKGIILIFTITSIVSCNSMTKKDWDNLQERTFYFQKFLLHRKGINDKTAFGMMKSFPVNNVMSLLADKYNITIDSSEYAEFVSSNTVPEFADETLLGIGILKDDYMWKSANENSNNIELTYYFMPGIYNPEGSLNYKIVFNINGSKKEIIYNDVFTDKPILEYIANDLGYSKLNPGINDIFVNNETKAQIDLSNSKLSHMTQIKKIDSVNTKVDNDKPISEERIKQYIKLYTSKLKSEDKKKFRDNIIKFLYAEME